MMRSMSNVVLICGVIGAFFVQCMASQTVHVVGDNMGWKIPDGGASDYATWASGKTFVVGDILVFNFATNQHDVYKVPKSSFESCSDDGATEEIATGPANITLSEEGQQFFICTIGNHCQAGQKLAVNASLTTTALSPQLCPPDASPSPKSGGPANYPVTDNSSLVLASLLSTFLSIAISFFY